MPPTAIAAQAALPMAERDHASTRIDRMDLLAILALLALALLVRAPSWSVSVIDWDESVFALAGREVLYGHLPYLTLFDNKPVGISLLFAAAMAIGSESVLAVRLLGAVSVGATAALLFCLMRLATGRRIAAVGAGILYIAFATGLNGLATHTEILLGPFTTAAVLIAFRSLEATENIAQARTIILAGLLFGLAICIKQVAALPAALLFPTLLLVWHVTGRRLTLGRAAGLALAYGVACALPMLLAAAVYWEAGEFGAFWYSNVGFMGRYVSERPGLVDIARSVRFSLVQIWPLLLLSAACILAALTRRLPDQGAARLVAACVLWTLAETAAAASSLQFFPHYFLLLLPPISVMSAILIAACVEAAVVPWLRRRASLALLAFIAMVPLAAYLQALPWMALFKPDLPRQVATVIRSSSPAGQTAYVVNFEPIVYLLAGLPLPTRYPFPPHLAGFQTRLTQIDPDAEMARILRERPEFIVVDRAAWSEIRPKAAARITEALAADYRLHAALRDGRYDVELHRRQDNR